MSHVQKVRSTPRTDGSSRIYWRATWFAPDGRRHRKNFERKGDAEAHLRLIALGSNGGSPSTTITQLAEEHYKHFDTLVKSGRRAAVTRDYYGLHIKYLQTDPVFARTRLCDLSTPLVQRFLDHFAGSPRSARVMRKSLVTWCKFGQRRGWLTINPAQPTVVETTDRPDELEERVDIPSKENLSLLMAAAVSPREKAVVGLLMFGGFRISELLGLSDEMVTLSAKTGMVKVREKLDSTYVELGPVKTARSRRNVPIGEGTVLAIRAWRMARGPVKGFTHKGARVAGRLFPNPDGQPLWSYQDFYREFWWPLLKRAGFLDMVPDAKGKNRPVPAFGPHTLRHVAASLWIEQGLQAKKVQELLGHSTIVLTMDLYGHLWRDDAIDDALAQASERLIR
jgi:integrase